MICIVVLVFSWSFTDAIDIIDINSSRIYQNNDQWIVIQPAEQNCIKFDYNGSSQGSISDIEITPKGRRMTSYHSHLSNVNEPNIKVAERTSALNGTYETEDSMEFRSIRMEISDGSIAPPFYQTNITEYVTVSSWDAKRKIEYSGQSINDHDYTLNDIEEYGKDINAIQFYNNKELSKERTFASPGIFSLNAKTLGRAEFKFNHSSKESSFEIDESYNGKFNLSMNNSNDFGSDIYYMSRIAYDDYLDGLCDMVPCWDPDLLCNSRNE